jgi:uncharacterized protein (TIGR01777 family)
MAGMPRFLIGGASGLVGSALVTSFTAKAHEVVRLIRKPPRSGNELHWDPMRELSPQLVSGFDVVVHLSGESVAGRWTEAKKARIRDSRVISTDHLARALAKCEKKPALFVCASAIGYYGNRGDEILTEKSPSGATFLAEVSREWETATAPAADAGVRTVNLRTGIVLSAQGGALKQMLLPFRMGLGGKVGDGNQWWSWIDIGDFVAAVHWILEHTDINGPVNMTAPNPVTNAEFTKTLARILKRPAVFSVPAFAAKLAFGELAEEGLLASARVLPNKLVEAGFQFKYPDIRQSLVNLLHVAA